MVCFHGELESLTFEKLIVIWLNIVTKGFLFQNSTYKKCNVVELKNALLPIKRFETFSLKYNEKFNVSETGYYFKNQETKVFFTE